MKKNIIILASICIICMPFSILSAQNKIYTRGMQGTGTEE